MKTEKIIKILTKLNKHCHNRDCRNCVFDQPEIYSTGCSCALLAFHIDDLLRKLESNPDEN